MCSCVCMCGVHVCVRVCVSQSVPTSKVGFALYLLNGAESIAWERKEKFLAVILNRVLQGKKLCH